MENAIKIIKMDTIEIVMKYHDALFAIKDELDYIADAETVLDILEYIVSKFDVDI